MVEIFKTNVSDCLAAAKIVTCLLNINSSYESNFDLEDCDRILRIENKEGTVCVAAVVDLLQQLGFQVEVLPD